MNKKINRDYTRNFRAFVPLLTKELIGFISVILGFLPLLFLKSLRSMPLLNITFIVFGIIIIVLTILFLLNSITKSSEKQIIEYIEKKENETMNKYVEFFNIDAKKDLNFFMFGYFSFDDSYQKIYTKYTKSMGKISTLYNCRFIFFDVNQIYIANRTFSLIDNSTIESSDEYFYTDVVGINSKSSNLDNENNLEIKFSNGEFLIIPISSSEELESFSAQLKKVLREKKNA